MIELAIILAVVVALALYARWDAHRRSCERDLELARIERDRYERADHDALAARIKDVEDELRSQNRRASFGR